MPRLSYVTFCKAYFSRTLQSILDGGVTISEYKLREKSAFYSKILELN